MMYNREKEISQEFALLDAWRQLFANEGNITGKTRLVFNEYVRCLAEKSRSTMNNRLLMEVYVRELMIVNLPMFCVALNMGQDELHMCHQGRNFRCFPKTLARIYRMF